VGRKIAIVARHPKSRYLAPFDDESFEIWTMSPFQNGDTFTDLPRWDLFFEIHDKAHLDREVPGAWEWLESRGNKVVWRDTLSREVLLQKSEGVSGRKYLTCTPAFCLAYAAHAPDKIDEVHLYGCDMATDGEYAFERPCVEFWLGVLVGRGVKVVLPDECDLCNSPQLYGFDDATPYMRNILARGKELEERIANAELELEQKRTMLSAAAAIRGELDVIREADDADEYMRGRAAELERGLRELQQEVNAKEAEKHMLHGCLEENKYHRKLV
jgi:hypothetical protein